MDRERERETGNGQFAHHLFYERVDGASLTLFERVNDTFLRYTFLSFFYCWRAKKGKRAFVQREEINFGAVSSSNHARTSYVYNSYIYICSKLVSRLLRYYTTLRISDRFDQM